MITIHKKDMDVLHKLNQAIDSTYPIRLIKEKYVNLTISSKYLCDRLLEIGLHHRKSDEIEFDHVLRFVPDKLLHHFIRGMFDGDGCIAYYKYPYMKKHSFHFGYTGLLNVVDYICHYFSLHTKLIKETNKVYTCTTKCITDIIDIKHILYKNATIYMDRKYSIFQNIEKIYTLEFK